MNRILLLLQFILILCSSYSSSSAFSVFAAAVLTPEDVVLSDSSFSYKNTLTVSNIIQPSKPLDNFCSKPLADEEALQTPDDRYAYTYGYNSTSGNPNKNYAVKIDLRTGKTVSSVFLYQTPLTLICGASISDESYVYFVFWGPIIARVWRQPKHSTELRLGGSIYVADPSLIGPKKGPQATCRGKNANGAFIVEPDGDGKKYLFHSSGDDCACIQKYDINDPREIVYVRNLSNSPGQATQFKYMLGGVGYLWSGWWFCQIAMFKFDLRGNMTRLGIMTYYEGSKTIAAQRDASGYIYFVTENGGVMKFHMLISDPADGPLESFGLGNLKKLSGDRGERFVTAASLWRRGDVMAVFMHDLRNLANSTPPASCSPDSVFHICDRRVIAFYDLNDMISGVPGVGKAAKQIEKYHLFVKSGPFDQRFSMRAFRPCGRPSESFCLLTRANLFEFSFSPAATRTATPPRSETITPSDVQSESVTENVTVSETESEITGTETARETETDTSSPTLFTLDSASVTSSESLPETRSKSAPSGDSLSGSVPSLSKSRGASLSHTRSGEAGRDTQSETGLSKSVSDTSTYEYECAPFVQVLVKTKYAYNRMSTLVINNGVSLTLQIVLQDTKSQSSYSQDVDVDVDPETKIFTAYRSFFPVSEIALEIVGNLSSLSTRSSMDSANFASHFLSSPSSSSSSSTSISSSAYSSSSPVTKEELEHIERMHGDISLSKVYRDSGHRLSAWISALGTTDYADLTLYVNLSVRVLSCRMPKDVDPRQVITTNYITFFRTFAFTSELTRRAVEGSATAAALVGSFVLGSPMGALSIQRTSALARAMNCDANSDSKKDAKSVDGGSSSGNEADDDDGEEPMGVVSSPLRLKLVFSSLPYSAGAVVGNFACLILISLAAFTFSFAHRTWFQDDDDKEEGKFEEAEERDAKEEEEILEKIANLNESTSSSSSSSASASASAAAASAAAGGAGAGGGDEEEEGDDGGDDDDEDLQEELEKLQKRRARRRSKKLKKDEDFFSLPAQAASAFPGLLFTVLITLTDGFVTGSLNLLGNDKNPRAVDKVIGVVGLLVEVGLIAFFLRKLLPRKKFFDQVGMANIIDLPQPRRIDPMMTKAAIAFKNYFAERYEWRERSAEARKEHLLDRYGPAFAGRQRFLYLADFIEISISISVALCVFLVDTVAKKYSPSWCSGVALWLSGILACSAALAFQFSMTSWHENLVCVVLATTTLAMSVLLLLVAWHGNDPSSATVGNMQQTSETIQFVSLNLVIFLEGVKILLYVCELAGKFMEERRAKEEKKKEEQEKERRELQRSERGGGGGAGGEDHYDTEGDIGIFSAAAGACCSSLLDCICCAKRGLVHRESVKSFRAKLKQEGRGGGGGVFGVSNKKKFVHNSSVFKSEDLNEQVALDELLLGDLAKTSAGTTTSATAASVSAFPAPSTTTTQDISLLLGEYQQQVHEQHQQQESSNSNNNVLIDSQLL